MNQVNKRTALAAAIFILAAACSPGTDSDGDATPTGTAAPTQVLTDHGVTDEACPDAVNTNNGCIYLGILSDLTEGPFAALGAQVVAGQEAFWQRVNEAGGVGGYDVNVTEYTRDNKYNPEEHVAQYRAIEPNILALAQSLGTPPTLAALEAMEADDMLAVPASWWSGWAFEENIIESGTSYCIAAMNGLDWASTMDNEFLDGDVSSVMVVHYPGDYGDDTAEGVAYWAETNDVEFVEEDNVTTAPNAVAGNQDGPVAAISSRSPDVVVLGTGPIEAGEIIGKAVASGFTGRFLGATPSWNVALLDNPDLAAVLPTVYRNLGMWGPFGADTAAHQAMSEALDGGAPGNDGFTYGWVWSYSMKSIIEQAIANGDLTRSGMLAASKEVTVDYEGALPARSYAGGPAETVREIIIGVPDPNAPLGLATATDFLVGPTGEGFPNTEPCTIV